MFATRFILGALLLSWPAASFAQATDAAPTPRFYGGLALYSSNYQRLGRGYAGGLQLPVQGTLGYQVRPRLAVQVGVAYSSSSYDYANAGLYYPASGTVGTYYQYSGQSAQRNASVALLGRYTLTRQLAHRVQFDLLGGLTLEHSAYHDVGTSLDSVLQGSAVVNAYDERFAATNLLLGAGPGVRCRFGRHFELVYDLLFTTNIVSNRQYQIAGITSSTSFGLRYRFGR